MRLIEAVTEKGKETWQFADYIGDVLLQNRDEQKREQKIREGALGRKIGSIPSSVYRTWQMEFERIGGKSQDDWTGDWRVFLWRKLEMNPEYRTVARLKTQGPADGHILVK
jgi:hypothetical protein